MDARKGGGATACSEDAQSDRSMLRPRSRERRRAAFGALEACGSVAASTRSAEAENMRVLELERRRTVAAPGGRSTHP